MVGKKIKVIRQKKGMSLRELANRSGIGKSTIFDIEQEDNNPTINTVLSLAEALEVPISNLFVENYKQNVKKEIIVSLTREDFKDLTELILAESSEENNEISIFTHDGSIKFGVDRKVIQTEVLAEYFEGEL